MAMRFEHEFTVPVPIEQAWAVLLDVERVAPCLPGAALDVFEGEEFTGRMKVKVGPITVTYRGSATFEDVDKDAHTLTLRASGKEARGSGTAAATVKARLTPGDGSTAVAVETTFNVTGRPAQFGRGVMAEVGSKLIDRFAVNLAELLAEPVPEPPKDEEDATQGRDAQGRAGSSSGRRARAGSPPVRHDPHLADARRGGAQPAGDRRPAAAQAGGSGARRARGAAAPRLVDPPAHPLIFGKKPIKYGHAR